MKKHYISLMANAAICLVAAVSLSGELGNKIAQSLCYTKADSIILSGSESAQYDTATEFSGQYQTEKNGVVITAKFRKRPNSATCEKSNCPSDGGDCPAAAWPIAKDGNMLKRTMFSGTE